MANKFLQFFLLGILALNQTVMAVDLHYAQPAIGSYSPLSEGEPPQSILTQKHAAGLVPKVTVVEEREVVDFESRAVSFERVEKNFGIVLWQYRYDEMDAYIANREKFAFADLWYTTSLSILRMPPDKKKDFNIFQMELPVQYPSWAQRILGKEPPKLSITGYEKIEVAYEYSKTTVDGSALQAQGTGGPRFDQENQFTVNGSVGRLINVNIKATTNKMDEVQDPLKNFKLEYKGEGNELEDEVIQEVSAGYMGFSMPGTSLAGYSNSKEGLIGIQVKSKIGPLELTSIASQEHGESQKASFDLTAGGGGITTWKETDFKHNKMFFLDTAYLSMYLGKRKTVPDIKKLKVFINNTKTQAEFSSTQKSTSTFYKTNLPGGAQDVIFKLLVPERDYTIDKQINAGKGCLRFLDSLQVQDEDQIGIYLSTSDPIEIPTKGDTTIMKFDSNSTKTDRNSADQIDTIWILKKTGMPPDDPNFKLMLRNVYDLPTEIDQAKFQIKVRRIPTGGGDTVDVVSGTGTQFSSILGLTDQNKSAKITSNDIFDISNKLLIIPPYNDTAFGNEPFTNPALGKDNATPDIYNLVGEKFSQITSKYIITMTGSSKKTSFQLGTGSIIAGTVKVKGDGQDLVIDQDYTVDYQFGTLTLISKQALAKNKIDVEFQNEALFVPKSKVFLGLHGEMKLPFGLNSFIGASILYQDAASQEAVPKIGQEPYSKVLLDVNTKMDFEPTWMTAVINAIPLLATDAKSTANFEMEVAHSITNPNTDKDAYIDDFESTNKPYTIGKWFQAAPPGYLTVDKNGNPIDSLLKCPPAWVSYWYQPQGTQRLSIGYIHKAPPNSANMTSDQKYENDQFTLECIPAPNKASVPFIGENNTAIAANPLARDSTHQFLHPWAGIMYPFPSGSIDRTKDKYFEFWAKGSGKLYVDMGELSEDICFEGGPPDGKMHNEDTAQLGGAVDTAEDKGLDGKRDPNEYYLVPNLKTLSWDTLKYKSDSLPYPLDPSRDNYKIYGDNVNYKNNFPFNNGTDRDEILTSKDLNGDGLSTGGNEKYFRRYIDFGADSVLLKKNYGNYLIDDSVSGATKGNGWHLYRIPMNDSLKGDFQSIAPLGTSPRWDRIKYVRLFWTEFDSVHKNTLDTLQFAGMQIVRNEWQEQPAVSPDSTQRMVKLESSSINTYDNPNYQADPPTGIPVTKDDQGITVKESSLRLNFTDIRPEEEASVKNILIGQNINLASYQTMSMLIHGDKNYDTDTVQFFFRFGANDSTYYEYSAPIHSGWSSNLMNIDLHVLSKYKQIFLGTTGKIQDSVNNITNFGKYSFGLKYRNSSPPNFSNITWMSIGVKRSKSSSGSPVGITGELWIDELKVGGVHQFNGWAGRIALGTNWAGFMNLGGSVNYRDGDFQQMTDTKMELGTSTMSQDLNASWLMSRFLPTQWGVNIPLGTSVSSSISRPSLVPNTDVYLTDQNNKPDDITDMYSDAINLIIGGHSKSRTPAEEYQTTNVTKSFYTSYDKASNSKNPIVNLLLERLSLDYKSSYSLAQNAKGPKSVGSNDDFIDSLTSLSYNGSVKYDLSPKPAPDWTKWKPLGQVKLKWLPDRLKNYELSLLPSTINFNVANIDFRKTIDSKLRENPNPITTKNLTLSHSGNLAWDPINILNLNYSLSVNRNLDNFVNGPTPDSLNGLGQFMRYFHQIKKLDDKWGFYYVLNGERDRTQTSSIKFDPTIWDWLTMSTDYSANYKQSAATYLNDPTFENMGVDSKYHLSTTLTLATLFKNLAEALPNAKAVDAVLGSMEKALTKIALNSFSFNYDASMSLLNNNMEYSFFKEKNMSKSDMLKYQLGLKGRSLKDIFYGNMADTAFGGMKSRNQYTGGNNSQLLGTVDSKTASDHRSTTRSFSVNSGFSIPEPISISISNIGLKWSQSFSGQPDPNIRDSSIIFPEIDVSGSTQVLNKINLITRFLQGVSLSSSFNYQQKLTKTYTANTYDSISSTTMRFAPLVGLDGTLKKWPIKCNYSHTWNSSKDSKLTAGNSGTEEHNNKFGATYELQKTGNVSEFKLLFWNVPLKGTFSVGLDAEQSATANTTRMSKEAEPQTVETTSFSFGPHSSYTFSDNITGEAHYNYSEKKEKSQSTTSHIFALSVTVNLK